MFRRPSRPLEAALLLVLALASPTGLAARTPPAGEPVIAITHATILTSPTGSSPTAPSSSVADESPRWAGRDRPVGAEVDRRHRPVRLAGHHRLPLAHRRRLDQRGGTTVSSMTGIEDVFNPDRHRHLPRPRRRRDDGQRPARQREPDRRQELRDQAALGQAARRGLQVRGAMPGIKFALGENPKDMRQFGQQGAAAVPDAARWASSIVIRDAFTRAKAYQAAWTGVRRARKKDRRGRAAAAPRPAARAAGRSARGQAARARALLSRRRNPDAAAARRRDRLPRSRRCSTCSRATRSPPRSRPHGAGRPTFADWWGYKVEASGATPWNAALMAARGMLVVDQLRQRRARAAAEHRGRQDDQVRAASPKTRRWRS